MRHATGNSGCSAFDSVTRWLHRDGGRMQTWACCCQAHGAMVYCCAMRRAWQADMHTAAYEHLNKQHAGGADCSSSLSHMHAQLLTCIAEHPSMLTGLACGRRAYQALTWLGVDPAVPRLGITGPIQEFQG